ncbi:MAG: Glucoamylase [uncultured Acidimicrobiales bacterium]|uniref:Glucoamylase n=1 Tax=uncultured Acidimicrobiales bacterium TaxID=310071 RepID=A0A6J4H837_9ACTN|nr:MAG: Glucoamylase [uncultured Acidimicrobiales bacterium]
MDTHAGAIDTGAGYVGAAMKRAGHNHGFEPLVRHGGYLPLEHFGLIGDGTAAALVGRDGTVAWLCLPRFDGDALFSSILDAEHGGGFRIAPADTVEARQRYEPDSGVLVTEMRSPTGLVHVVDCLTLRSGADLNEMSPLGAVSCSAPSPSSTAPSTWRSPWSRAAAPPPSGPARSSACARPRSRAWISTSPRPCPWTACARGSTCRSTTAPTSCSGGEAGLTAPTLRRCRRCWRERWRRGDAGRAQPSTRWSAASEPGTGCSPGICPKRSIRALVPSWGTTPRRSATWG